MLNEVYDYLQLACDIDYFSQCTVFKYRGGSTVFD